MHSPTLLGLMVVGGLASQALADNAHLKVQFFQDANCQLLKPDNDRNPSDLNPRKNECERPDHHLPSGGFGFRSIKYSFRGDDWKSNLEKKYSQCTLHAFNGHECKDKKGKTLDPDWSLTHNSFYEEVNSTSLCHTLTSCDDKAPPFYSLMLDCTKDQKELKDQQPKNIPASDVVVVLMSTTETNTLVINGVTTSRTQVDLEPSTVVQKPPITVNVGVAASVSTPTTNAAGLAVTATNTTVVAAAIATSTTGNTVGNLRINALNAAGLTANEAGSTGDGPTLEECRALLGSDCPLLSDVMVVVVPPVTDAKFPGRTLLERQATITSPVLPRHRFHARDVTAKAAPSAPSHEVVVSESDVYKLLKKLGDDLNQWIRDLQSSVDQIEQDVEDVDCGDDDCQVDGDDLWPSTGGQ